MSHRADIGFFDKKQPWSKRKDAILAYYLKPYLAKVATLRHPILLVDGFAGAGRFEDGEIGSSLILCSQAQAALERKSDVRVWCIEPDAAVYERLQKNLRGFEFAEALHGKFEDFIDQIDDAAQDHTVFVYLDPWTVGSIKWDMLARIARHIDRSDSSIELLLNFHTLNFLREGRAAFVKSNIGRDSTNGDRQLFKASNVESSWLTRLDDIVGGKWWREILQRPMHGAERVEQCARSFGERLRSLFPETGFVGIRARDTHPVPKYHLFFASRHHHGLVLMNDSMVKNRGTPMYYMDMFLVDELRQLLFQEAIEPIPRDALIVRVIRRRFCCWTRAEIRGEIQKLLEKRVFASQTGKVKINRSVPVWRVK